MNVLLRTGAAVFALAFASSVSAQSTSTVTQTCTYGVVDVGQTGSGSESTVTQSGTENDTNILQAGTDQTSTVTQTGIAGIVDGRSGKWQPQCVYDHADRRK